MEEELVPWWQWCRLCAKQDHENNLNVADDIAMTTAIGKYFWVNIKSTDPTQHICQDCYILVNELVSFTERVNKVQAMLCMLQNAKNSEPIDPYDLRSQYDLLDEDFEHIVRGKSLKQAIFYHDGMLEHDTTNEVNFVDGLSDHQDVQHFNTTQEITGNDEDTLKKEQSEENANLIQDKRTNAADDYEEEIAENNCDQIDYEQNENVENVSASDDKSQIVANGQNRQKTVDESITPFTKISKFDNSLQETPRYVCSECGKNYKNATSYRKHLESHNIEPDLPDFLCDKCNKIFPTVRQLIIHNRIHLPLEKKLIVPCSHCDKKFTLESVMKQHVSSVHFNEKPFMCEECGLSLKTLASFNDHKITHSNEYPYECEICQKRFKHKTRLKTHMDTHTETAYVCNQCGVRLNTKRTLKMHMLVHSEDRAYKCNFCDAEFKRGKALKNHLILHIGLRPYTCNFCGKTFTNGSNCRSHKKRFHPAELAAEEAAGLKTEPTSVPKISELRARNDIKRPTTISRNNGGLPPRMRALLIAAEQRSKNNSEHKESSELNEENQIQDCEMEDESSDMHLVLEETDDDTKDSIGRYEECEETVVYEFIEDSSKM